VRGLLALVAVVLLVLPGAAKAQGNDDPDAQLQSARTTLDGIVKRLGADDITDTDLAQARRTLLDFQRQADAISGEQSRQLQTVQSRLTELGAAPAGGEEPPDVAAQRQTLQATSSQVEARVKLARLLSVESAQAADRAGALERDRFHTHLFERTDSVLSSDSGTTCARACGAIVRA
jgi:potassium-dependent mechanosensitive channel